MTRTAAVGYARRGIRVDSVGPGFIETPLLAAASPEIVAESRPHPHGRLGRAEEVAELVAFLASDGASNTARTRRRWLHAGLSPRSGRGAGRRWPRRARAGRGRARPAAPAPRPPSSTAWTRPRSVQPQAAVASSHGTRRPPTSRRTRSPSASTTVRVRSVHATMPDRHEVDQPQVRGAERDGESRKRDRANRTTSGETRKTARGFRRSSRLMVSRTHGSRARGRRDSSRRPSTRRDHGVPASDGGRRPAPFRRRASRGPHRAPLHWFDAAPARPVNLPVMSVSRCTRTSQARRRLRTPTRRRATLVPPHPAAGGFFLPGPPPARARPTP